MHTTLCVGRVCSIATLMLAGSASAFELQPVEVEPLHLDELARIGPVELDFGAEDGRTSLAMLQDAAADEDEAEGPDGLYHWQFRLGVNGSWGNTDTQSAYASLTVTRETVETNLAVDTSWLLGFTDGDSDRNRFTVGGVHDWLLPKSPKWLLFVDGRYTYDDFQSWKHRVTGHGGFGYIMIDNEKFKWTWRGGIGAIWEALGINEGVSPEALAGFDATWQITERQKLEFGAYVYPDLSSVAEFRTYEYIDWSVLVDPDMNLSLNIRFWHEHQSQVSPGFDRNDYYLIASLGIDF